MTMQPKVVLDAQKRLKGHINKTPLLQSQLLNKLLNTNIFFKFEGMQKVGAFKARGALNTLLTLKEQNKLPKEVVAYSSGNHSQAVAWAAKKLGIKAVIIMPKIVSKIKIAATKAYGAKVILVEKRQHAEDMAQKRAKADGAFLLPPFDNNCVIAGQGTAALEAWQDEGEFDAVFAPCGGGGLLSGTYLATKLMSKSALVFASEPKMANDASRSYKSGKIFRFDASPMTIADGVRTPGVCERTFNYLKKLDGFYEITEQEIIYWTQWLMHLLKVTLEPTSALGMAAAYKWLREQRSSKKILIIVSGGNIDPSTYEKIWEKGYLDKTPKLKG